MEKRWSFWNVICSLGIPQFLLFMGGEIYVMRWYYEEHYRRPYVITNVGDLKKLLMWAGFFWLFVVLRNSIWLGTEKKIGLLTWMEKYKYEPPSESPRKIKAQHPPIPDEYLSVQPSGLCLGKWKKRFVNFPIAAGHALSSIILGTPGSGKSTLLLTTLIYQLNKKPKMNEPRPTYFILDCKPELLRKSSMPGSRYIKELSIQDRSKYGWDVFFDLDIDATDDEILEELDVIARALIDAGKNSKNEFFYESARAIFKFVALSQYKRGRSFMQIMDYLMDCDMSGVVRNVLENAEGKPDLLKVKRGLAGYKDKQGEAFAGIELAFRQSLDVFQKDATRFFLDGNPRKLSPETLEKQISVAFTIKTTKIKDYKTILRLVVMQLLHHCEDRDEDESHLITMVIDEAYRLGLINWIDFLSVCRSKQVSCILAFQSLSQIQSVWSKEDADSLLEMVSAIAVLSCASENTAKLICSWAGEYSEEKISTTYGGKSDGTTSRSFETRKILQPSDIMALKRKKEIILFLDGEYFRADVEKARYFKIPELKEISKRCVEAHKRLKKRGDNNGKYIRKDSTGANAVNNSHGKTSVRLESEKAKNGVKKVSATKSRTATGPKNKTASKGSSGKTAKSHPNAKKVVGTRTKGSKNGGIRRG